MSTPPFPLHRGLQLALLLCATWPALAGAQAPSTTASTAVLAAQCAACHGPQAHPAAGMPPLSGWKADALRERLRGFRTAAPSAAATVMPRLVKGLSDAQIDALAQWFGAPAQGGRS